jgi:hypothetical protein
VVSAGLGSTRLITRTTLSPTAMGKRRWRARAVSMWIAIQDLPRSAAHPFYTRLNHSSTNTTSMNTSKACASDSTPATGGQGWRRGRYFRLLLIWYFEKLDRAMARSANRPHVRGRLLHSARRGQRRTLLVQNAPQDVDEFNRGLMRHHTDLSGAESRMRYGRVHLERALRSGKRCDSTI